MVEVHEFLASHSYIRAKKKKKEKLYGDFHVVSDFHVGAYI